MTSTLLPGYIFMNLKENWLIKYGPLNTANHIQLLNAGKQGRFYTQFSLIVMLLLLRLPPPPKKKAEVLQKVFEFIKYL